MALPRIVPVSLVLLVNGLSAPTAAGETLWGHTARAVGLMVEGKLEAAVGELARARQVKAAPELDALVGLVALQGREPRLAVRQLDRAIRRGSTEPLVFYWAARAQLAAGNRGRALGRLRQGLAIADRPQLHVAHAMLLHAGGQDGAAAALQAAARGQPNLLDPSLYPTPTAGAVDLMGRILAAFPARLLLLRTEGHLLWQAGRVTAACRRFAALLKQTATDPDGLQMMARCSAAVGERREALELVGKALERAPGSPHALATRGELLLELGQADRAVKDLRKAADLLPRDARLLTRLAQACTEAEQPSCARRFFAHAVRREPGNAAAAFGLALHLQREKKPEAAAKMFDRALALAPDQPRYWRAAASFDHQQGNRARARQRLAEARRAGKVQRRLARARRRMAGVARAVHALARALEQPTCAPACRKLLWKVPGPVRQFAELHLAAKQKHPGRARKLAQELVPRLALRRLLLQDPTDYQEKGRTRAGRRYVVRTTFPYVPPWRFPAR